jgi:hypothetical protein
VIRQTRTAVSLGAVLVRVLLVIVALSLAGCGATRTVTIGSAGATSSASSASGGIPQGRPQAIEPTAGMQAAAVTPATPPVGDVNAHAPSLAEVKQLLREEVVATRVTNATYTNPLYYVTCCGRWERTDQGVDATLPVGAPILAPGEVKILDIEPDWYAGQPLVYFELLNGPDAGKVQYVAEQITDIAPPGSYLQQGQPIARFAASGTGIEYGWSTLNGITLARATTGYEEGEATPAGQNMRDWLNALGANAGNG